MEPLLVIAHAKARLERALFYFCLLVIAAGSVCAVYGFLDLITFLAFGHCICERIALKVAH
jgi:hypothetical protein